MTSIKNSPIVDFQAIIFDLQSGYTFASLLHCFNSELIETIKRTWNVFSLFFWELDCQAKCAKQPRHCQTSQALGLHAEREGWKRHFSAHQLKPSPSKLPPPPPLKIHPILKSQSMLRGRGRLKLANHTKVWNFQLLVFRHIFFNLNINRQSLFKNHDHSL